MDKYERDETGQWWCYTKRQRVRAKEYVCEQCRQTFPNRHPQRFCSKECRAASQKGVLRIARPQRVCEWCAKPFEVADPGRPHLPMSPSRSQRFCSPACRYQARSKAFTGRWLGENNPRWKGGIKHHAAGYTLRYVPGRGHVLEHRLVMEEILGRPLERFEEVHHRNGQRAENQPENLELWIKRQPGGQRAIDLLEYARWIIATYEPLESKL